ncbi:hypothetical protein BO70DRAFT_432789 [Aspergillus heteromorphus CBS 117.55]|uniref:Uncharacterized protein n=1 Tax=Aspergillus heteromorphus CBS 117.55 TaxID=1448321 RepID=A0A317V599_9EURO|nr:uncharacterized protein BO70DRAFT_432789 [Aspergillus heteromorphus CBS 117.55]PWY68461.1 hypothetical protein BO70DRAFT_432789 [Aspergillus heteromorphus CBS 117.55]
MSSHRVIQDSDDEDDPLVGPEADTTHVDMQDGPAHYHQPQETGHGSHMNVNFDQFLKSQESVPLGPSSSQQRREERWIPAKMGRGSLGSMMTEIGMAQQRLFDDDEAQYVDHTRYAELAQVPVQEQAAPELELPAPGGINHIDHGYIELPEQHDEDTLSDLQPTLPDPPLQHVPGQEPSFYEPTQIDPLPLPHTHEPTAQTRKRTSSNYTLSTGASYNIFESSLRPSDNSYPESNHPPTHSTGSGLAYKSPRRHNSALVDPYSPHDTEPFSSARLNRSKSDNAAQQSQHSVDELAAPVPVPVPAPAPASIPGVEKKRGRKKKQSLPENDEDDDLAHHNPPVIPDGTVSLNKPEKRKPGRPPKNAKPLHDDQNDEHDLLLGPEEPDPAPTLPNNPDNTSANSLPLTINESPEIPTDPSLPPQTEPPVPNPKPSKKSPKEPKKKKLKRGKTMSITQTKTYHSDIEEDVIWVDERPLVPPGADKPLPPPPPPPQDHHRPADELEEQQNPEPEAEDTTLPDAAAATAAREPESVPAPPAPKKRGRKRKNPVDEPPPPIQEEEQPQQHQGAEDLVVDPTPNPEPNPEPELQPDHTHHQHHHNPNKTQQPPAHP